MSDQPADICAACGEQVEPCVFPPGWAAILAPFERRVLCAACARKFHGEAEQTGYQDD